MRERETSAAPSSRGTWVICITVIAVASKISQIYERDLSRKRKATRDKKRMGAQRRRAYSFAPADSWTIARREGGARARAGL